MVEIIRASANLMNGEGSQLTTIEVAAHPQNTEYKTQVTLLFNNFDVISVQFV